MKYKSVIDGIERQVYQAQIRGIPVDYVKYDGCKVRPQHLDTMLAAAKYTQGWGVLHLTQGGISRTVKASARTHYDLDAVDASTRGRSKALVWTMATNLFETGNLPFPRGYVADSFQGKSVSNTQDGNEHIHDIYAPAKYGHTQLQSQYHEWIAYRGDGLIGPAHYTGPTIDAITPWKDSMFNPQNRVEMFAHGIVDVTEGSTLLGLDRYRRKMNSARRGQDIQFIAKVKRWGRDNYLTGTGLFYAAKYIDIVSGEK